MSTKNKPLPAEPLNNAANDGVAAEFASKQRNERKDEDGNDLQDTASVAT